MTSTSGRSRTIRSPRATCCLTIVVLGSAVRLAGLAQDLVRDADLADVVEQAGDPDRGDLARAAARAARRGTRRSGRRPRSAASCSDPWCRPRGSGPGRRRTCASRASGSTVRPGDPDGVAAAGLGFLERSAPATVSRAVAESAWSGNSADAGAHGQRQALRTHRTGASGRRASPGSCSRTSIDRARPTRPGRRPGTRPGRSARRRRRLGQRSAQSMSTTVSNAWSPAS